MPSPRHDALERLFTEHPEFGVDLLRDHFGVDIPATPLVRLEDPTFNTRPSDDIEADAVIVAGHPAKAAHAVIVEIQLDKSKDPRKLARYAAALWLMLECDVSVLVVCAEKGVANHYDKSIASGLTGYRFRPVVLGPADIPLITDPKEAAKHPELAVMGVMTHGRAPKVAETFMDSLQLLPEECRSRYYECAYSMSGPEVRAILEEIMSSASWLVASPFAREHYGRGRNEGRAEGKVEGKAEGEARAILLFLRARGIAVPKSAKARIMACTDSAQLEAWTMRAATVESADELFDDAR